MLDLAIERMPLDDPQALAEASLDVFRWKTASYTTIAPLMLAFLASGMTSEAANLHCHAIGLHWGRHSAGPMICLTSLAPPAARENLSEVIFVRGNARCCSPTP